jgi:phospholipid-transporting ATPase
MGVIIVEYFFYTKILDANQEDLKSRNVSNVDFCDQKLYDHIGNTHPNSEKVLYYFYYLTMFRNFIFCLALCHSIIVEKKNDENIYNASSPDELALVNAAKYFGVEFTERTEDNNIIIKYNGTVYKYLLLHIFEFNSNRKRMSVIIRDENDPNNKKIKLICKGADSVIIKRLDLNKRYIKF